jgi:hypothetical protein
MSVMKDLPNLLIEQTSKTPRIELNRLSGELIISGKSIPENANKVYEPVLNWVSEYILNAKPKTNLRLDLEYFNTSTSLWLAKILKVLIRIKEPDYSLIVYLYLSIEDYDDIGEFGDILDAFAPIAGLFSDAIPSIGIKICGTDDDGKIIKDKLIFI